MSSINTISSDKLARLIGSPRGPCLIDLRRDEDFALRPSLVPGSVRRSPDRLPSWSADLAGRATIVIDASGGATAHGAAAWLRTAGCPAEILEGGIEAWIGSGHPAVPEARLPPRDAQGRTLWVSRERPKVDRIACPWLIRRFVDPQALFLFVPPAEVAAVGERFGATPFDVEGAFWSHRGAFCTFDTMIEEFGLATEPLQRLARIVRAADTDRLDLAPQAAGLLAASLGLSRLHADDMAQLDAGMALYDAFYRWCRDAVAETHNWPGARPDAKTDAKPGAKFDAKLDGKPGGAR